MPSADPSQPKASASKPFSISFGATKPKPKPVQASAPKKRPHAALAEQSDDEDGAEPTPQLVSAFDQSGAVIINGGTKVQGPLVIKSEKNRDWREESRKKRRKNLLPAEVQAARQQQIHSISDGQAERDEVSKASGLEFAKPMEDGDIAMQDGQQAQEASDVPVPVPKTADDEAMEALLGAQKKSTLQITATEPDQHNGSEDIESSYDEYTNEDDRFRADVASRPDGASIDEYAATPVDEFGAAVLRGMGWKEGEEVGKRKYGVNPIAAQKPRNVERRPALLGIGAKEVPGGVGDEVGAWGKGAKGKRKTDLTYNPVVLKNSVTGELLTEEELAKKREEQSKGKGKGKDDWRERRDRNLRIDQEKKGERREKERLLVEGGRNGEGRRDRHRSRDEKTKDRSPSRKSERRDRSRDSERNGYSSSRRRSRSRDRSHRHSESRKDRSPYRSSRRDRSRSSEGRHRRY